MEILTLRVLYLCEKYHVSCYALEKALHFSDGAVRKWAKSPPSAVRIVKVAKFFGVSTDFLLGLTDNPKSHLSNEPSDIPLQEVKSLAIHISQRSSELQAKVDSILKSNGTISEAGIEIYSDEVMNDPELPRMSQFEETAIEEQADTE